MTICLEGSTIFLRGHCEAADAEGLVSLLSREAAYFVDIAEASTLHTAVVQILIARAPIVTGPSADAFVNEWIVPLLNLQTSP